MTEHRTRLSPERIQTIRELFDKALAVPASSRAEFLTASCGNDASLRFEVESLLVALDRAGTSWESPEAAQLASAALRAADEWFNDPLEPGTRLGPYLVKQKIGEGGMGTVYEAVRDDETYDVRVAIKTLGRGAASPSLARRMIRERQILAGLQHPNIASLIDGGATERGLPYLVMEFVDGEPLDKYCAANRLSIPARLDLFRQVCGAIQYAHRKLVIHRDLKPSNILVSRDGVVKLLDFGIAKLALPSDEVGDGATHDGHVPLTSAYASPEQARGEDISTASDVYSAGVVLYRLLAGAPPYMVDGESGAEVRRILAEVTPALPSSAVTAEHAASCAEGSVAALRKTLTGELDAIAMMALRKEPERRYASIEALSEDIHRYLKGLTVSARPDTWRYRFVSFARRRRALVAGSAIAVLSLLGGSALALRQAQIARDEATRARRITQFLGAVVGAADPGHYSTVRTGRSDVGLLEVLDSTRAQVGRDLSAEPRIRADLYWSMANAYRAFGRHELALLLQDSARGLHAATIGDPSIEVARDIHFAGVTLQDMGRSEDAVVRFREAREQYLALPAAPDTEITDVETSLGQILGVGLNKFEEGERLLRSAAKRLERESTPRYAMRGLVYGALGTTLVSAEKLDAADSAFTAAIDAYAVDSMRARGERGYALVNWGMMKSQQRDYATAVRLKRRALDDARAAYGPEHLTIARFGMRLAEDLIELGQLPAAHALVDSTIDLLSRQPTSLERDRAVVWRQRATIATREGRTDDARLALEKAESFLAPLKGVSRATVEVSVLAERSRLAEALGRLPEAVRAAERSYAAAQEVLGERHILTRAALNRLVAIRQRLGDRTHGK